MSEFRQGSFTQTIDGLLYFFIKPKASNKAATAPPPDAALTGIEVRDESGALSPLRKNPETGELYTPVPGTRAAALVGEGLVPAGGVGQGGAGGTINPSAITASAAADGARGQTSAVPVEPVNVGAGSGTPNVINAAPPGPKDTVAPANPPQPPTDEIGRAHV